MTLPILALAGVVGGCNSILGFTEGRPEPPGSGGAASGGTTSTGGAGGEGAMAGSGGGGDWWNAAWSHRVRISFDNSVQNETLSNMPVGIRLTPERLDYAAVGTDGQDLRFVDADGTTLLAHEIELWQLDATSTVWLRVPAIDAQSSTDHVWLYYGNAGATDQQNRAGIWSSQNAAGVYHLTADLAGNFPDVVGGHTALTQGDATASAPELAVFGGAAEFDGTDDYLQLGAVTEFAVAPDQIYTISGWFQSKAAKSAYLMNQEGSGKGWLLQLRPNGELLGTLYWEDGPATGYTIVDAVGVDYHDGAWHHAALVIDRVAGTMRLMVDGSTVDEDTISSDGDAAGTGGEFATDWSKNSDLSGLLDAWWVLGGARSEEWARATYLNGLGSFVSFGSTETLVP